MLSNFSWLVPGSLAGMAQPGGWARDWAAVDADLDELKQRGVGAIASLTEDPLPLGVLRQHGMRHTHIPVADMAAPTMEQIDRFVEFVQEAQQCGLAVAVHCAAGMGRTGTMLAAFLVSQGVDARTALERVRRLRPGSVETSRQEAIVYAYSALVRGRCGPG